MTESKLIYLIPEKHSDSVRYFFEFFKLKPDSPDLPSLQKILEKFALIPYENISKIIKLSRSWENENKLRLPEEVMNDHANFYLGGTCFSLTFFLEIILLHQEFQCYPVIVDMKAGRNVYCAIIVLFDIFAINKQLIEQARVALQINLAKEQELGTFKPKIKF